MNRALDDVAKQRVFRHLDNAIAHLRDYTTKARQTIYVSRTVYGRVDSIEFVYKTNCDSRHDAIVAMHTYVPYYDKATGHIIEKNVGKMYLKPELYEQFVHIRPAVGMLDPNRRY